MSSTETLTAYADLESAVAEFRKRLEGAAWQLVDTEIVDLTQRHHRLLAQLQSIELSLVRELDTRGIPDSVAACNTRAYLSGSLRISPQLASEQAKMATALAERYPTTGAALAEGDISYEQARAIAFTVDDVTRKATAEQRTIAESILLDAAGVLNAHDLRRLHKRLDAAIDPDGVGEREEAARSRRSATIRDHHDGTQLPIHWRETDENMAIIKAAVAALAAPAPAEDGTPDPRTPAERRADALLEIVTRILRHGDLPTSRGERPHVHITATIGTLRTGTGFGRTASGEDISGQAIRRLACDADIFGILLNDNGVPLNVGRKHRTVTPGQWIALVARDVGCIFPNCTRPAAMCDAHHRTHWADNGNTDLNNLALACGPHHDDIHHHGWDLEFGPDGKPQLRPPPWIDPQRRPVTNTYWHADTAFTDDFDHRL